MMQVNHKVELHFSSIVFWTVFGLLVRVGQSVWPGVFKALGRLIASTQRLSATANGHVGPARIEFKR